MENLRHVFLEKNVSYPCLKCLKNSGTFLLYEKYMFKKSKLIGFKFTISVK